MILIAPTKKITQHILIRLRASSSSVVTMALHQLWIVSQIIIGILKKLCVHLLSQPAAKLIS